MEFEDKLKQWMELDYVPPEDIPNIDLYMDQITTFLEEQLKNTKRYEEDKIFTKTMINNYSKNGLLPPSNKKKYSRNHMILLIYIYYLKSFLSISDIKNFLKPLTDTFYNNPKNQISFFEIYKEIFQMEHNYNEPIRESIMETFEKAQETFPELSDGKQKELLQKFSFITLMGYDIYLRKQVLEKMIDELYQDDETDKKKKK
ncbi:DUF1836 domain-containing protein [Anaerostipes sp. MSJ-23]|uniref:DUF1836 domain-containing protein n=1 Tax=Anaerostipes sp. MSJ-23 TaxID=2841520 RepID=UPI001C0F5A13|nr:DUF1836 domain-containing protein [Anaerostipes sp. MSJ-23]MBU5458924.1 DUF1836 domain-containing protein [Anaerostipes sp. MSJ-23]